MRHDELNDWSAGGFARCARLAAYALIFVLTGAAHAQASLYVTVIEYVNEDTGRRVLLANPAEILAVTKGAAGAGWRRSGVTFGVYALTGSGSEVFRFYAPSSNSHFFTANADERNILMQPGSGWLYEGADFKAELPVGGVCPANSAAPVYRYYNNRAAFSDSTHRYSSDRSLKARLEAKGWSDEGIAFCTYSYSLDNLGTHSMGFGRVLPAEECAADKSGLTEYERNCVAINHQPAMPFTISFLDLPEPYKDNPNAAFTRWTGLQLANVITARNPGSFADYADIDRHSFVQKYVGYCFFFGIGCTRAPQIGLYVVGRDRNSALSPATSINPVYKFPTLPPLADALDQRVMPWRGRLAQTVQVAFSVNVKTLRRANTQSHAYGHPTITLFDTRSGRRVLINIVAFSLDPLPSTPEADFSGWDSDTGNVIVSTVFRGNPGFGERVNGSAFVCDTAGFFGACYQGGGFTFRLRREDIPVVLAKARAIDPALSASIADYAIDSFSFKSEVVGDAEIGLVLAGGLSIFAD